MSLEAERGAVGTRESLQGAVEQRAMRRTQVVRQGRLIDRETMILARDEHPAGVDLRYRMIGPVVAELHLQGLGPAREPQQLVAQADAEDRYVGLEKAPDRLDGVIAGLRVTGSVT